MGKNKKHRKSIICSAFLLARTQNRNITASNKGKKKK